MLAPRKKLWSTPIEVIDKAIEKLCITSNDTVFDIGAGDGRFLIRARECTDAKTIVGIEIDEERGNEAINKMTELGYTDNAKCHMHIGNALQYDYSEGTVFFLYLVPRGLKLILPILKEVAMCHPIRVATYMSPLVCSNIHPIEVVKVSTSTHVDAQWPLYIYRL